MLNSLLGLSEKRVETRKRVEKAMNKEALPVYHELVKQIKAETASSPGSWKRVISSKLKEEYGLSQDRACNYVMYCLRTDPNLISRTEEKGQRKYSSTKLQPFSFRWVPKEDKIAMGFHANANKYLNDEQIDFISEKMEGSSLNPEDILYVVGLLVFQGAHKNWIQLNTLDISVRCMQPIENIIDVLFELTDRKMLIVKDCSVREKIKVTTVPICTLIFSDENYESRLEESKDQKFLLDSAKIKYIEIAPQKKKNDTFLRKIRQSSHITNTEKTIAILDQIKMGQALKPASSFITLKQDSIDTKSQKKLDKDMESVTLLKEQLCNLVDKYQENLFNVQQMQQKKIDDSYAAFAKLEQEREEWSNKLQEKETECQLLRSKLEIVKKDMKMYKDFSDNFIMNAQESLDLFLGQIVSAVEGFTKQPVYKINNETVTAKFKRELLNIVGDTSKRIMDYRPESKFPPALK